MTKHSVEESRQIDKSEIEELYVNKNLSIVQIAELTGVSRWTVRKLLHESGVIRSRSDGIRIAAKDGRLGGGLRGKTRSFTSEWIDNIRSSARVRAERSASGLRRKPNGYIEFTRGENKNRGQHVVVMEQFIGRRLHQNEVVHHIDHDRSNNQIENLVLMTRSEHASLHGKETSLNRKRASDGKFE